MNWNTTLIVAAVVAVIFMLKRAGQISTRAARAYLQAGALVVDVRSRGEFNSGHLPDVINIPVDELETQLPRRIPDRNRVLLLHCASGLRSGTARRQLKRLGYANVFNLGSFSRAESILKQTD